MTSPLCSDIVARAGGVITDELGAVTGELTLCTEAAEDGTVVHRVRYRDSDEWYLVSGSRTTLADGRDVDTLHAIALALLAEPGSGRPSG